MPGFKMYGRGAKRAYTMRQIRMAHHIEDSELAHGAKLKTAQRIGWAKVNKTFGGALRKKKKRPK
jgi:hypothetical protein